MQTENRFFEDLARVAGGAMGALSGVKAEIEALVRQQFERLTGDMNLVSRDEFDAVQAMAAKARAEQERLEARVTALEAQFAAQQASQPEAGDAKPQRRGRTKGEDAAD